MFPQETKQEEVTDSRGVSRPQVRCFTKVRCDALRYVRFMGQSLTGNVTSRALSLLREKLPVVPEAGGCVRGGPRCPLCVCSCHSSPVCTRLPLDCLPITASDDSASFGNTDCIGNIDLFSANHMRTRTIWRYSF